MDNFDRQFNELHSATMRGAKIGMLIAVPLALVILAACVLGLIWLAKQVF